MSNYYQGQIEELENKINTMKKQESKFIKEIKELRNERNEKSSKKIEDSLAYSNMRNSELNFNLEKLSTENQEQRTRIKGLIEEKKTLLVLIESKNKEVGLLRDELENEKIKINLKNDEEQNMRRRDTSFATKISWAHELEEMNHYEFNRNPSVVNPLASQRTVSNKFIMPDSIRNMRAVSIMETPTTMDLQKEIEYLVSLQGYAL